MSKFKKVIASVLMTGLLLPSVTFAQTPTSTSALILQLQAQIATLQAQIKTLMGARTQVQETEKSVKQTVELLKELDEGLSGTDVQILQAILAAEGEFDNQEITGFFGKKTSNALRKLQRKYGLDPAGRVGKKTMQRLNQFLRQHPIIVTTNANGQQTICAVQLPGKSLPPGWLKRMNRGGQVVPVCDSIPQSILDLFGIGTSTLPNDTKAPTLSSIHANSISQNGATINWNTNEGATTQVEYGTTSSYGNSTTLNSSLLIFHNVALTGLASSTTYHYRVISKDGAGNTATSEDKTFTTSAGTPSADTTAPSISGVSATNVTATGATIVWNTNEGATSQVEYGTTASYSNMTGLDSSLVTSHSLSFVGLSASTTYHFRVWSKDAANNVASSTDFTFTTGQPADVTAPIISAVSASGIATTTASISWTTDEPATSKVYYGTAASVDLATAASMTNVTLDTSHTLMLTGLSASTTYFYVVQSKDAANNTATNATLSFVTTQ